MTAQLVNLFNFLKSALIVALISLCENQWFHSVVAERYTGTSQEFRGTREHGHLFSGKKGKRSQLFSKLRREHITKTCLYNFDPFNPHFWWRFTAAKFTIRNFYNPSSQNCKPNNFLKSSSILTLMSLNSAFKHVSLLHSDRPNIQNKENFKLLKK